MAQTNASRRRLTGSSNGISTLGAAHENVFESMPEFRWGIRVSVYKMPCIVGAANLLLIILFIVLGLGGIAGIYMLHFVIAITFLGVLISILETVLVRLCIKASLTLKAMEKYLQNQDNSDDSNCQDFLYVDSQSQLENIVNERIRFKELEERLPALLTDRSSVDGAMNDIQEQRIDPQDCELLQPPGRFKTFLLLIGFVLLNFSITLVFWGLAVIRFDFDPPSRNVYLLVDMVIGVASPLCFTTSIYTIGLVGRYITKDRMRTESLIPAFLTFVKYEWESKVSIHPYWTIVSYFHFPIYPKRDWGNRNNRPTYYTPPLNVASWCLGAIVSVTFCLSMTYIVGQLLTGEQYVLACSEVQGDGYQCFDHSTSEYINCSSNDDTYMELDCFRFNQVGVHSDPIGAIITALFLYLACEKFLTVMFKFVKEFFKIHPSRVWGFGVTSFGLFLIALSISCSVVYDKVHSVYFDFQKLLQLFIISVDVFLSGVLLFTVKYTKKH